MKKKIFGLCLAVVAGFSLIGCGNQHNHDFSQLIKKENPTCTVSGMEAHYLCSCGKYFDVNRKETTLEDLVINALEHAYEDSWETDVTPTCLDKGSEHRDCTRCGADGRETRDVAPLGHNMVLVSYLAPTCTKKGHLEYYECSRKNCTHFSTDAKGAIVIKDITAWLDVGGEGYIAPTGKHVYAENVDVSHLKDPADCEHAAVYYKSCSCGLENTETFSYGDPLGHDYGTLVAKVNKTCTTDGLDAHYQCGRCEKYFTTAKVETTYDALVIKAGHEIKSVEAVDPDFEKDGHIAGYECDLCHEHYSDSKGETKVEDKDWFKSKLASTEALDKVVYYDLTAKGLDACDTGLEGYSFMNADLSSVDVTGLEAGDEFTCYAAKQGATNYKISGLVVTKVIKNGADFNSTLNCVTSSQPTIQGYFVLGNDITDLNSNAKWNDACHDYKLIGTLDGRGHKIIKGLVQGDAGLFGARTYQDFTIKDLTMEDMVISNYGVFGFMAVHMTLDNVKISAQYSQYMYAMLALIGNTLHFNNSTFDNSANPGKPILSRNLVSPTFENTTILKSFHNEQNVCDYTDANFNPTTPYQGEYDDLVTFKPGPSYEFLAAQEASFKEGAHGDGYYCHDCDKYFTDGNHENEIAKSQFFTSDKLPSTKVVGKELFYNLATKAMDISEDSEIDVSKLVDAYKKAPSFEGKVAGDMMTLYLPGTTNYEYDVRVVTDIIAKAEDYAAKLDASSKDLIGYYVLTADMNVINTVNAGSHTVKNTVDVTVDGRNHTINTFVVKNSTGGMFGCCSSPIYNVVFKNFKINKVSCAAYGMFGYCPANGQGTSLLIENCDLTAGGTSNRYGLVSFTSNARITLKDSIFDFSKNDFSGAANEVYCGSFIFGSGVRANLSGVTMVIISAHDTYKNNYTEGSTVYKDVIKPDAVVGGKSAEERNGLNALISGITFVTSRA